MPLELARPEHHTLTQPHVVPAPHKMAVTDDVVSAWNTVSTPDDPEQDQWGEAIEPGDEVIEIIDGVPHVYLAHGTALRTEPKTLDEHLTAATPEIEDERPSRHDVREPSGKYTTHSRKLTHIDRDVRTKVMVGAEDAMKRALERAGARVVSKSKARTAAAAQVRELIAGVPMVLVAATVFRAGLLADVGIDEQQILDLEFEALSGQWDNWVKDAQVATATSAAKIAGVPPEQAVAATEKDFAAARARGWDYLSNWLRQRAIDLLSAVPKKQTVYPTSAEEQDTYDAGLIDADESLSDDDIDFGPPNPEDITDEFGDLDEEAADAQETNEQDIQWRNREKRGSDKFDFETALEEEAEEEAYNIDVPLITQGIIRNAIGIAGGYGTGGTESGFGSDGRPVDPNEPVGGIGTGTIVSNYLGDNGVRVVHYEWMHGVSSHPFEPHQALDGIEFERFDDDQLRNENDFPAGAYYHPGDHDGCSCDFVVLWTSDDVGVPGGWTDTTPGWDNPDEGYDDGSGDDAMAAAATNGIAFDWDESQHPRDAHGRFGDGEGGGDSAEPRQGAKGTGKVYPIPDRGPEFPSNKDIAKEYADTLKAHPGDAKAAARAMAEKYGIPLREIRSRIRTGWKESETGKHTDPVAPVTDAGKVSATTPTPTSPPQEGRGVEERGNLVEPSKEALAKVHLDGVTDDKAGLTKQVAARLTQMGNLAPGTLETFTGLRTDSERNVARTLSMSMGQADNVYAFYDPGLNDITINRALMGDRGEASSQDDLAHGWSVPRGNSVSGLDSTVSHEYGHHVAWSLKQLGSEAWIGSLQAAQGASGIKPTGDLNVDLPKAARMVSGYACSNPDEFAAEMWCEYATSPNPRPIAKAYGDTATGFLSQAASDPHRDTSDW